jgi:hypothetical protein
MSQKPITENTLFYGDNLEILRQHIFSESVDLIYLVQPHRKRYWLTPPPDDPAQLAEQICTVCEIYEATPALAAQGTHVMSTDEMTGIQALERLHPSLPMLPGHVERQECE